MQIEKKIINFEDERGSIRDILIGKEVDAITLITFKKGGVRGNHYHKKSIQYSYIVSGKILCATQKEGEPIETHEVIEGDLITHAEGEIHAFKALDDSVFLSLTKGPRKGDDYEDDTFRVEPKILS